MHQTYPSRGEKKNKSDDHYFITNALNSHDKDIDTILKHCAISICEAQNAAHVEKSTSTIWTNKPGVGRWGVIAYTAIKRYKIHVLITRHKSLFLSLSPSLSLFSTKRHIQIVSQFHKGLAGVNMALYMHYSFTLFIMRCTVRL